MPCVLVLATTEALKPQIVPAVHSLVNQFPSASVYVTGHSLGAAMAVLSAAHLQTQEGVNVDEIYTFGLPRVGDAAFSTWFNQNIPQAIHVTHHDDVRKLLCAAACCNVCSLTRRRRAADSRSCLTFPRSCSGTTTRRLR